jgi:hypothetical protein
VTGLIVRTCPRDPESRAETVIKEKDDEPAAINIPRVIIIAIIIMAIFYMIYEFVLKGQS